MRLLRELLERLCAEGRKSKVKEETMKWVYNEDSNEKRSKGQKEVVSNLG